MDKLIERLNNAFSLTEDLISELTSEDLLLTLGSLPSNSIGEQVWCINGARESYLQAIIYNEWVGFSCSLSDVTSRSSVLDALEHSSKSCIETLRTTELNDNQIDFVFLLLEHEVQHHGQLIRYIYGNKLPFPDSWKNRYNV